MSTAPQEERRHLPGWIKAAFLLLLLGGMLVVVWQQLPRTGVSTDLSVIGEGKPVLVLTRDVNLIGGAEVLELLATLQPEYQDRVLFRIAHTGQPDGRFFSEDHQTHDADLTLLDDEGNTMGGLVQPRSTAPIRELLDEFLAEADGA